MKDPQGLGGMFYVALKVYSTLHYCANWHEDCSHVGARWFLKRNASHQYVLGLEITYLSFLK
jgi:hypothetical protein